MKYDLYDFDGTIYDGDSGVDIVKFAIKKHPSFIFSILASLGIVILYKLGIRTKEQMKTRLFSFLSKIDDIDSFVKEFWETHEHKIKNFWIEKKNHSKDVIISASAVFWLKPIADKYKVCALIATDVDPRTGEVIGANCHGKEKVRRFYEEFPKGIVAKMYTDSVADLPLIEEAKEGILVKRNNLYNYYEYKPNFIVRFWRWGWGIYHKNEEIWNYLIVGGLTTVVSLISKYLLWFILDPEVKILLQISIIISWIITVLFAYIMNKVFVFRSKSKKILEEMVSFYGGRIFTLGLEMILMWLLVSTLSFNKYLSTLFIQVLIIIFNYVISKIFVFRR
jgi:HAD superfamily phosphoserine phosphatase-like hydrolase